jgi:site-specific recombinase XerD
LNKYLYSLKQLSGFLGKDFDKVAQKDMEEFIKKLDNNNLTSVSPAGKIVKHKYTRWTRHDIEVVIKKFYKWLWGNNIEHPGLVSWIDTHVEESDPPALSIEEIRCML